MKKIKLFGKIIEVRAASVEKLPPVSSDTAWQDYLMGNGCSISADTALQVAAVFRCVDLISKTMAALPLHMYRDRNDGKQFQSTLPTRGSDHPTTFQIFRKNRFNPRSPRGGATEATKVIKEYLQCFNPRSPRGGATFFKQPLARTHNKFQSTLPTRGSDAFATAHTEV